MNLLGVLKFLFRETHILLAARSFAWYWRRGMTHRLSWNGGCLSSSAHRPITRQHTSTFALDPTVIRSKNRSNNTVELPILTNTILVVRSYLFTLRGPDLSNNIVPPPPHHQGIHRPEQGAGRGKRPGRGPKGDPGSFFSALATCT